MERKIGPHVISIEGDVLKVVTQGTFELAEMQQFVALSDEQEAQFGYRLTLNDVTRATGLTAAARRYIADRTREARRQGHVYVAGASFGANFVNRVMIRLFYAALRLTSGGDHANLIAKDETEARAFLDEQRRRFQAARKLSGSLPT